MSSLRSIIHLDLDAFFASVEQLDFPELRGTAVAVGSRSSRGVVAAASYEARSYGVRSAMPMRQALRLCPCLKVQSPRMERYQELSRAVFAIYARYTDLVEPLSLDEAFLDVTGSRRLWGEARDIAMRIRREVFVETTLVVSAGVAHNKFLAKLASDLDKPDGFTLVNSEGVEAFLAPLAVRKIWGVGEVMEKRLGQWGVRTIGELQALDRTTLSRIFGRQAELYYQLCRGRDDRVVVARRAALSVSQEQTFEEDIHSVDMLLKILLRLSEKVGFRLRKSGLQGRCVSLKLRYDDFSTLSRSRTLDAPLCGGMEIHRLGMELLKTTQAGQRPVRLIGIGVSDFQSPGSAQPSLFDEQEKKPELDGVLDEVWGRFGRKSLVRGTLLEQDEEKS